MSGKASVKKSVFRNGSGHYCGCICVHDQGILEADRVTATSCRAQTRGGAMWSSNSTLIVMKSVISNSATKRDDGGSGGGGIHVSGGSLELKNSNLTANDGRNGGAVQLLNGASGNISACRFVNNTAALGGHVNVVRSNCSLTDNLFLNGSAIISGGSLYLESGKASLRWSTCARERAGFHGGSMFASKGAQLDIDTTSITDCTAERLGGAVLCESCTLSMTNSTVSNNTGNRGAGISVSEAGRVALKDLTLTRNRAGDGGGALHVKDNATVEINGCSLRFNQADETGGDIFALASTVNVTHSRFVKSNAARGGSLLTRGGTVTVKHSAFAEAVAAQEGGCIFLEQNGTVFADNVTMDSCKSERRGGAVFSRDSHLTIQHSTVSNSLSPLGGGVCATDSGRVLLRNSELAGNTARRGGALDLSQETIGDITSSRFSHNRANESGGHVYAEQSTVDLTGCLFSRGDAKSGGMLFTDSGDITINGSRFEHGTATDGGCISAQNSSTLLTDRTTMRFCESSEEGGAVWVNSSTLLSVSCVYEHNTAKGRGGAVSFRFVGDQAQSLQLRNTTVRNNRASYGGGLHLITPEQTGNCSEQSNVCTFVVMTETVFVKNRAWQAGGALFMSNPVAVRFSCRPGSSQVLGMPYSKQDLDALKVLETSDDVCPSWRGNRARVYGDAVASYARSVSKTFVEDETVESVTTVDDQYTIKNHRSGSRLATIIMDMSDAFGQTPAIGVNNDIVVATMTSPNGFFTGSLSVRLMNGSGIFEKFAAYQKPGNYTLKIEFSEAALHEFVITVEVRNCNVGEMGVADRTFCQMCSAETYNISPDDAGQCLPCPENGNCTTNFIHPRSGYWIQSPCSNKTQRCLTKSACDFDSRDESIDSVTHNLESCDFDKAFLENYTNAQCKDGYRGPLCGSCGPEHGRSQSFLCEECFAGFANATLVVLSILVLFLISGITVRSSCASVRKDNSVLHRKSRSIAGLSRSRSSLRHVRMVEMVEIAEGGQSPEIQPSPAPTTIAADNELSEQEELSKWKAAELFKITVNNLQVTAVAISINVDWQSPLLSMLKAADFLSGMTAEVTSRSVDCLVSDDHSTPRAVIRVFVSLLIPAVVMFLYFVLWTAIRLNKGESFAYLLKKSLLSAIAVLYVSYISLTRILTNILNCVDVYGSDPAASHRSRRWIEDTTVHCYHQSHAVLAGAVGCPFLLLCSLGFPITLACVFIFHVKENIKTGWIYETAGFMYRAYRPSLVFWESVIMLRKAALAIIVVFAYPLGGNLQGILGTFVLVLALYAQLAFQPYRSEFDVLNKIEGLSLLVSLITFVSSQFFYDNNVPIDVRTAITVGVLFCNLGLFLFFIGLLTLCFVDHLKFRLQVEGVEYNPDGGIPHLLWVYCRQVYIAVASGLKHRFVCWEKTNPAAHSNA